jgi:hypothetical protein
MSLLSSLARKKSGPALQEKPPCPHTDLAPRWDTVAAMGKPDLITHYLCCACGEVIPREEAAISS